MPPRKAKNPDAMALREMANILDSIRASRLGPEDLDLLATKTMLIAEERRPKAPAGEKK